MYIYLLLILCRRASLLNTVDWFAYYSLATQSVVHGQSISITLGACQRCKILGLTPEQQNHNLHLTRDDLSTH